MDKFIHRKVKAAQRHMDCFLSGGHLLTGRFGMDGSDLAGGRKKNWHESVFFGLHFDLHAEEKDIALGRNLSVAHLVEQLGKVKPDYVQCDCKGHPGLTSYPTVVGTPAPGIEKDSLAIWREAARILGIPLAVHYSGVWDAAALKKHPEWGRVNLKKHSGIGCNMKPEIGTGRDTDYTCPLAGYTEEYMVPQMLEIIDRYDVDGFWVDGENWASKPCYCDKCVHEFIRESGVREVPLEKGTEGWDMWLSFHRKNFEEHVRKFADAVHRRKPECTVCSNWIYTVRQPDEMAVPVDYLSGDFDYIWSIGRAWPEARFLDGRGMSWDLMAWGFTSYGPMKEWTFKSVPALCQEAAVIMSSGGSFMIYDQPNRTGELVEWHMDRMSEVARFCRARQPYCQHSLSVPQVVLLHGKEHFYLNNGPLYQFEGAEKPLEGALHAMLENHFHVDILTGNDLMKRVGDYPLCIVAEQDALPDAMRTRLEEYVFNGGNLIVTGADHTRKFDVLAGVSDLGVLSGEDQGQELYIRDGEGTSTLTGSWRLVETTAGEWEEPLLFSRDRGGREVDSGSPAAVIRRYGKGKIALVMGPLFGSYFDSHYPGTRRFIKRLAEAFSIGELVKVDAPVSVYVTVREKENRRMVHFLNMGTGKMLSPRSAYVEEVPSAGPVKVLFPLDKKPSSVFLAPSFQPLRWEYTSDGKFNAEIDAVGIHDILVVEE